MRNFLGVPYPIRKSPQGFLYSQSGINQIKSDMLCLLLTNPGDRVMNPSFGTPLNTLAFDPNDPVLQVAAKNMIAASIAAWEPRIKINQIQVQSVIDNSSLNSSDNRQEVPHILSIKIIFVDPQNIKEVQELLLEVPLS